MRSETGTSLVEILVVMVLLGIGLTTASFKLYAAASPVETAATLIEGFVRQARARAVATTSAVRIFPDGPGLAMETSDRCTSTTWTPETSSVELPAGTSIAESVWSLCFTSRGVTTDALTLTVVHDEMTPRHVEVFYGGSTRISR